MMVGLMMMMAHFDHISIVTVSDIIAKYAWRKRRLPSSSSSTEPCFSEREISSIVRFITEQITFRYHRISYWQQL